MATSADIQTYNSDLDAFELYHQEKERLLFAEPELPALGHGLAGSVGAAVSNAAIYPLNLLLTRAQTRKRPEPGSTAPTEKVRTALENAQQIYNDEGLRGLYAGLGIDTVKHSLDSFLFFMAYNTLRQNRLKSRHGGSRKHLPVVDELGIGFLAGAFSKFFTSPLSNIVTRLQSTGREAGSPKPGVRDIAARIRAEKGITGFWTGYSAQLILTLNPSLTFFFHEALNNLVLPRSQREHPPFVATFLLAALSKSFASCVTYPFTLAKARAQTTSKAGAGTEGKEAEKKAAPARVTIFTAIRRIAQQEGLAALYEGLELEVFKGFISHGLTMVIKDFAHAFILKLYWAILKMRNQFPDRDAQVREGLSRTVEAARESLKNTASSARELGTSIFDEAQQIEMEANPLKTADDLVQSAKEWSKTVADDVFNRSEKLRNHKNAEQYRQLLVNFIEENTKGKDRTIFDD